MKKVEGGVMAAGSRNMEDLVADPYYLRKGAGFTPDRARRAGILIDILGGPGQPYPLMRERLPAAIDTLNPDNALLLRTAFGLEPSIQGRTLKARRLAYGRLVNRRVDTVTDRENRAIEALIVPLLTEQYALSPYGESATLMHTAAIQTNVDIHTVLDDGFWVQTTEQYRTLCLYEGAEYLEFSTDIPAMVRNDKPTRLEVTEDGQGRTIRFYPVTPYRKGQLIDTQFTLLCDPSQGSPDRLLHEEARAFHVPTLTALFQVDFHGRQPETIWHYQKKTYYQRPGNPDDQHRVHVHDGQAAVRFRHLHDGLWTGIAWKWGNPVAG
jgi:hypothetical protein